MSTKNNAHVSIQQKTTHTSAFNEISKTLNNESKLAFEIYPSPTISNCVVDPYNASLRCEGEMNVYLNEFQTTISTISFMTTSMAPTLTHEKAENDHYVIGKEIIDKVNDTEKIS